MNLATLDFAATVMTSHAGLAEVPAIDIQHLIVIHLQRKVVILCPNT